METQALRGLLRAKGIQFTPHDRDQMQPPRIEWLRQASANTLPMFGDFAETELDPIENPDAHLSISVYEEEQGRTPWPVPKSTVLERIQGDIEVLGTDALAWYTSFHFETDKWGIFVPTSSLEYLRTKLYRRSKKPIEEIWSVCLSALLAHESHHFRMDYLIGCFEGFLGQSIWSPAKAARQRAKRGYLQIEEAVAEAALLRRLDRHVPRPEYKRWRSYVSNGLPGYREGPAYVSTGEFQEGLRKNTRAWLSDAPEKLRLETAQPLIDFASLYESHDGATPSCPVYLIEDSATVDRAPIGVQRIDRISKIKETTHFQKRLKRLPQRIRRKWAELREQLAIAVPPPPQFKKLKRPSNEFEVRVTPRRFRAILVPDDHYKLWRATNIGTHKDVGTG